MIFSLAATFWRRFWLATVLWIMFWPILWFIRLGDITGYNAFYWITGELNYPVTAVVYALVDSLLSQFKLNGWLVFLGATAVAALSVPLYSQRVGFTLGVFLDAYLF